ncbi:serine hydrolase domain-containing protein [Marinactinospora thermotolerans]|uniref:CubicO group peptidase, beta-lactamase class C family n=1 Tax=Marinactinospora thermotolerans DSM 45154 TaxID=1122192 RepID=A0A1T4MYA0_9ACTN|nr:serine hydrolase domain-containing protein [Marinactinospora thermotolerans]SJZ72039.1 CubicO group peptidase, beta-lactamase class C family [Marinactinospora thermotolerans DSM 45154]
MRDGDWVAQTGTEIRGVLKVMVDAGWLPGGVAVVGTDSMWEFVAVGGIARECGEAIAAPDVYYDTASLTKVMATWPLVGLAVGDGALDLDAPMGSYFPGGPRPGDGVTARQILTHTSRLNPVTWLERYVGTGQDLAEAILSEPLDDTGYRYIDRGFILLGLLLERLFGAPLDRLAEETWRSMGLSATTYGPLPRTPSVAPTERRIPGAAPTWGVVHDESAALMGGVAGHAGVFTTATDLGAFARELLRTYDGEGGPQPLTGFVRESWRPHVPVGEEFSRGLAWLVTDDGLVYHNGYTGTSLYLYPETGRYVGLLTNAVYHGRRRVGLFDLRAAVRASLVA